MARRNRCAPRRPGALTGHVEVPGDKSISHRALILGALAVGETRITGLLEGRGRARHRPAMQAFGATVERLGRRGSGGSRASASAASRSRTDVIDHGNSGTGVRLVMGAMATTDITATFTGDASLRGRPMGRITDPLALFGAEARGRRGGRLPITLTGAANPIPVHYTTPVPSAQVKSAVLLAGLNAPGETVVIEQEPTRDHTERMLAGFGATVRTEETRRGPGHHACSGQPELRAAVDRGAARPELGRLPGGGGAAGRRAPRSPLPGIGLNPTRAGHLRDAARDGRGHRLREPRARRAASRSPTCACASRRCKGVEVPPERAPSMIDEYPILAALAATAEGVTVMRGINELRVKESDRIDAMARGLEACGVTVEEGRDYLIVHGRGAGGVPGGATVASRLDHRIAMSFLCLGLAAKQPITVDDAATIATSFPDFVPLMRGLGGRSSAE